jgi:hypothetical protein
VSVEPSLLEHDSRSAPRFRDNEHGKKALRVILFHRICSRSRIARGFVEGAQSAKTESIIFGGLGATMPGAESGPKIREDLAPPRKYPSRSAP